MGVKRNSNGCFVKGSTKEETTSWKGGRSKTLNGYIRVWQGIKRGYVLEHRLVMEGYLDRKLDSFESVHHINGDRTDNRIENLELMNKSTHATYHHTGHKLSEETKRKIGEKNKISVKRYYDNRINI